MSSTTLTAPAFVYGDDINTDYIIAGKYKFQSIDMNAMALHAMEELDPDYYHKLQAAGGGFLVAGTNFGCGSSREQAPLVLLNAGTKAVLAKSFARIFFRNAINTGLPVVVCDTDRIAAGDELTLDLATGVVHNNTKGDSVTFAPLPPVMTQLLEDGGLAAHIRKHKTFAFKEE
ncbi:MAG: 3-isopropylmalate dehydratase [Actinomycetia bacterium]|nr:3-isopropylmalate dehydratase [Actinomycetes bacterium]